MLQYQVPWLQARPATAAHFLKDPFIPCNCTYPIQTNKCWLFFPLSFMQTTHTHTHIQTLKSVINPSLCTWYINTPCNCFSLLVLVLYPVFSFFLSFCILASSALIDPALKSKLQMQKTCPGL